MFDEVQGLKDLVEKAEETELSSDIKGMYFMDTYNNYGSELTRDCHYYREVKQIHIQDGGHEG